MGSNIEKFHYFIVQYYKIFNLCRNILAPKTEMGLQTIEKHHAELYYSYQAGFQEAGELEAIQEKEGCRKISGKFGDPNYE